MTTLAAVESFGVSAAFCSRLREAHFFGFKRAQILPRIQTLAESLSRPEQERLIRIFAEKGILARERLDRILTLGNIQREDLSSIITTGRLNAALREFNSAAGTELRVEHIAQADFLLAGEEVADVLWGIRDSLLAVVNVLDGQRNFMQRLVGRQRDHILNRTRNLQILRLLYIVATNFAGIEEVQHLDRTWYGTEVEGAPKEVRNLFEYFLNTEGDFLGHLQGGVEEMLRLMREEQWLGATPQDQQFQTRLSDLISHLAADRENEAQLAPEQRRQNLLARSNELSELLVSFREGQLGRRGMEDLQRVAENLGLVVDCSPRFLSAAAGTDEHKEILGEMLSAAQNAVWDLHQILKSPSPRLRFALLKYSALVAMTITTLYLLLRLATTVLSTVGYLPEALELMGMENVSCGPWDKLTSWMLLVGEVFFDCLALVYMRNLVQVINTTKGGNEVSHLLSDRQGLARQHEKRGRTAHLVVLVDEPIRQTLPASHSEVLSAWQHGNADVLFATNSRYAYNVYGDKAVVREGQRTYALLLILKKMATQVIAPRLVEREGSVVKGTVEAELLAHALAGSIGAGYTEADDPERQTFSFERAAEILREMGVPDKEVAEIGREIGRRVMAENPETNKDTNRFFTSPFTRRGLVELLTSHGVSLDRATVLAGALEKEINSIVRCSRIAKTCNLILQKGRALPAETEEEPGLRAALRLAMMEENHITAEEADQIIDYLQACQPVINAMLDAATGKNDFSATEKTRRVYHEVHKVMEQFMRQDKCFVNIEEELEAKLCQLAQKAVMMEGEALRLSARAPVYATVLVQRCQKVAKELASRISNLPQVAALREEEIAADSTLSFEEADAAAWARREIEIRRIVDDVLPQGNGYGIGEKERDALCKGIIDEFKLNREVRQLCSHELAEQVLAAVKDGGEKSSAEIAEGILSSQENKNERGVMLDLLLDDIRGLRIGRDHPLRPKLKQVAAKFNPTLPAEAEAMEKALQEELDFSAEQAHGLVEAYRERHESIVGGLTRAVDELRGCVGNVVAAGARLEQLAAVSGGAVRVYTDAAGNQCVDLAGIGINFSAVSKECKERVRQPNYGYTWGAKGGTINAILLGDCVTQNIGEISRWITHRLVNERFFPPVYTLSPLQRRDLSPERAEELDRRLAGVKMREVTPEWVNFIDQQITGDCRSLVPKFVDPRLTHPDFVASFILARLTASGCYNYGSSEAMRPAEQPGQIAQDLLDLWGGPRVQDEAYQKALHVAGEFQMRLAVGAVVNLLGNDPRLLADARGREAEVENLCQRAALSEAQTKVVQKRAEQMAELAARELITFEGSGSRCFLRLSRHASHDVRQDRILHEHYTQTLARYYHLTEDHGSSAEAEKEEQAARQRDRIPGGLDQLEELIFKPEAQARAASVIAAVANREQFCRRVLELELSGKSEEEQTSLLIAALGLKKSVSETDRQKIAGATAEAAEEVRRKFGVFFAPLMASVQGTFVNLPSTQFGPEIGAALGSASFLSEAEKKAFETQAVAFVELLQDLHVKAREEGALSYVLEGAGLQSRLVVTRNEAVSVRELHQAHEELKELQLFAYAVGEASAAQAAENIIIRSDIPLVTPNRESFGLEIQKVGALVDEHFGQILPQVQAKAEELDKEQISREEKVRRLNLFVVGELNKILDGRNLPCKMNYFAENTPDGSLPLHADCSTLYYDAIHVNDADYRESKKGFTRLVEHLLEHPGLVHTAHRQAGRNFRQNALAMDYQSGGNAYWTFTNQRELSPSWGAQMCYSTRAYRVGAHVITEDFHRGTIKDKFMPNEHIWKKVQERVAEQCLKMGPKSGLAASIGFQTVNIPLTLLFKILDVACVLAWHAPRDLLHTAAEAGWVSSWLEKEIDREKLINKKVNQMQSAQAGDTESEDISTDMTLQSTLPALMDETRPAWENPGLWLKAQFGRTGTYHFPLPMFSAEWMPGIWGLGSHSGDLYGKFATFDGRWLRGNINLIFEILFSHKYGAWRKIQFLALAGFWSKGMARPMLLASPLVYIFFAMAPMRLPTRSIPMMTVFFAASFAAFALNMGVFLASMYVKGYLSRDELMQGLGCLFLDWTGAGRQWQSVWEGVALRGRPGFLVSGKEDVAPAQLWPGALAADYAVVALHAAGAAVTVQFMENGGGVLPTMLVFWCSWNTLFGAAALWRHNQGVVRSTDRVGSPANSTWDFAVRVLPDYFAKYAPAFKAQRISQPPEFKYASEEGRRD